MFYVYGKNGIIGRAMRRNIAVSMARMHVARGYWAYVQRDDAEIVWDSALNA